MFATIAAIAVLLAAGGCGAKQAAIIPAQRNLTEIKKPRDLSEHVLLRGLEGGAKAGRKELEDAKRAAVVSLDDLDSLASTTPEVVELRGEVQVIGARCVLPFRDRDEAVHDAIEAARVALKDHYRGLDIPKDKLVVMSKQFEEPSDAVKQLWEKSNLETDRVWASVTVKTSDETIREARSKSRLLSGGLAALAAFLLLGIAYGFLRLDTMTKGYLTLLLSMLAGALVLIVLGVAFAH